MIIIIIIMMMIIIIIIIMIIIIIIMIIIIIIFLANSRDSGDQSKVSACMRRSSGKNFGGISCFGRFVVSNRV